jgi:hypothetical protein
MLAACRSLDMRLMLSNDAGCEGPLTFFLNYTCLSLSSIYQTITVFGSIKKKFISFILLINSLYHDETDLTFTILNNRMNTFLYKYCYKIYLNLNVYAKENSFI